MMHFLHLFGSLSVVQFATLQYNNNRMYIHLPVIGKI